MYSDKKAAKAMLTSIDSSIDIMNDALREVERYCPSSEFEDYKYGVGAVMAEMYIRLKSKILESFPDLET